VSYGGETYQTVVIGKQTWFATGNVTGRSLVGGLVGTGGIATITNSYATGNVTGTGGVGGLVGRVGSINGDITIAYSYATGNVTGTSDVGGLVGNIYDPYGMSTIIISSSYYDKQTTGQTDTGKGEGKTTVEMKIQSTYVGWDFASIWGISSTKNNGYPTLQMRQ